MNGDPAGVAAFLIVVAVTIHHYNKKKHFWVMVAVVLLWTVAAFFAVLAATPSLGPVWAYTGDGPGLAALVIVGAVFGIGLYHALRHREHFHPHGTPFVGVVAAVALALAVINIRHVGKHALGAVAGSWKASGTAFHEVNAGKVRAAVPATVTGGSRGVILAVVAVVVLLFAWKMVRSFGGSSRKRPGGGPAGIPGGPGKALGK